MKCPSCSNPAVRLRDRACARCGTPTTLNALLRQAGVQVRRRARQLTAVRCPACGQTVSLRVTRCPFCSHSLTVGTALHEVLQPAGQRGKHLLHHPPPLAKHAVQWLYLLGSAKLVSVLLLGLAGVHHWYLVGAAALSIPYLAVGLVMLVWIGPRPWQRRLAQQSSALVKIALLFNFFSLLLAGQHLLLNHWECSLILGGVIGVIGLGFHLAGKILWPVLTALGDIFRQAGSGAFDPSQPQGRKGRFQ